MKNVRVWTAAAVTAAALGLIYAAGSGAAGESKEAAAVVKIAAAIKKGDMDGAKGAAEPLGKKAESMEEVMEVFKPKSKGGLTAEGIEKQIRAAARDVPKAKDAPGLEEAAYAAAAVGLITEAHTANVKDSGKKMRKNWQKYSQDMISAAQALAKAAKGKAGQDMKSAATKLNESCNACHSEFRN